MTVVRTITLGYVVLIVLFAASAFVATVAINGVKDAAERDRREREELISGVKDLSLAVNQQIDALRATLMSTSVGPHALEDMASAQENTKKAIAVLRQLDLSPDGVETLAGLETDLATFDKATNQAIELASAGHVQAASALGEDYVNPRATLLNDGLTALAESETKYFEVKLKKSQASTDRTIAFSYAFAGVSFAIAIVLAIFIPRFVSRQMRGMISRLGTSTAEMLSVTSQVASGAVQTATAISEASTTVDEVRQTSLLASQKATAVSDNAQAADQVAESGRRAVAETLDGIRRIQEQMSVVADSVVRLSEQTDAVGEIIATSNDIAEQSNLLSVNAAIEAAKASEQGKGFSVVAEEIKSLSQQSKQGVMQVRSILTDIQRATSAAVMAAEQSGKAIEDGAAQALESSQAIESLAENVAAAAQSAMQIVASSQQQLVGMDQISEAMASIDQASAQNASGARQMEDEVQFLRELAYQMQSMIDAKAHKARGAVSAGDEAESATG
jgi:methyl-accepting chemotaxis protein